MFGGKIKLNTKTKVGDTEQNAWSDDTLYEYDIEYDGELTEEVQRAIRAAWWSDKRNQSQSSWGALYWFAGSKVQSIDVERRKVIVNESWRLAD